MPDTERKANISIVNRDIVPLWLKYVATGHTYIVLSSEQNLSKNG